MQNNVLKFTFKKATNLPHANNYYLYFNELSSHTPLL